MKTRTLIGIGVMAASMIPASLAFLIPVNHGFVTALILLWIAVAAAIGGHAATTPRNGALAALGWFTLQAAPYVAGILAWDVVPLRRLLAVFSSPLAAASSFSVYVENHALPFGVLVVEEGQVWVMFIVPVVVLVVALVAAIAGGMRAKNSIHRGRYWD